MLFGRSFEKLGLHLMAYMRDGDNNEYSSVYNDQPCGLFRFIGKEDCALYVTKKMTSGLRNIVKSFKVLASHKIRKMLFTQEPGDKVFSEKLRSDLNSEFYLFFLHILSNSLFYFKSSGNVLQNVLLKVSPVFGPCLLSRHI